MSFCRNRGCECAPVCFWKHEKRIAALEAQLAEERAKRIAAETTADEAVKQSDEAKGERALSDKMKESWKARAARAEKQSTEEHAKREAAEIRADLNVAMLEQKARADSAERELAEEREAHNRHYEERGLKKKKLPR